MHRLNHLTGAGKVGVLCFLLSLSIGYFTGLLFVNTTTSLSPIGIERITMVIFQIMKVSLILIKN